MTAGVAVDTAIEPMDSTLPEIPAEFGFSGSRGQDQQRSPASRVVVLLPALNEEGAIGHVIHQIPRRDLERSGYDVSVVVVDGHSSDATREIAVRRGASVFVQGGNGKGNAVRQAIRHLICPEAHGFGPPGKRCFFLMMDADGTYPPQRVEALVHALEAGYDVVLGSRFLGRVEDGAISGMNRLGNRFLSAFARFLFQAPVSDVCTGMWGFSESFLQRSKLMANGFDLEADIFASACSQEARIAEVAVDYRRRIGEPKLVPIRAGFVIAWCLFKRWLGNGASAGETSLRPGRR